MADQIDKQQLYDKVYAYLKTHKDEKLEVELLKLAKVHFVWQVYVETVYSLGMMWKCFGKNQRDIPDRDYSLAHLLLFKNLSLPEKRVIIIKMEELMNTHKFLRSIETLDLFKTIISY